MRRHTALLLAGCLTGLLFVSALQTPVATQAIARLYATYGGGPIALQATSAGALKVNVTALGSSAWPITAPNAGAIRTGTTPGNTLLLQGYNTSGTPAYNTVATITAANGTPTIEIPTITGQTTFPAGIVSYVALFAPGLDRAATTVTFRGAGGVSGYGTIITPINPITNASDVVAALSVTPTYNQTSVAGAVDLLINRTETAVGSGLQSLIDAQVAGASRFRVSNLGGITTTGVNGQALTVAYNSVLCTIASDTNCTGKGTGVITITNAIPAGALVLGVTVRVNTILAGSDGLATFGLGVGATPTLWGATLAKAATTTNDSTTFTAATSPVYYPTATSVLLTGTDGKLIDSGVVRVTVQYLSLAAASS